MENILLKIGQTINWLLEWPLMIYVIGISIICTIALRALPITHFVQAWKDVLMPKKEASASAGDMTPFQAFINTLSANIGNGSLAGMGAMIYAGGPGAAVWAVMISFLLMSVRFAEVYISTLYGARASKDSTLGGPMLYLRDIPGGSVISYIYAMLLFVFGASVGSAMQANSIALSLKETWGISPYVSTAIVFAFVSYVLFGGAARIVKASDSIVPVKVGTFFITSFIVLAYHYKTLYSSLVLMIESAFSPVAAIGGLVGFTVLNAIHYGAINSIMATESGLGTAAVLFGFTGSKDAKNNGLMGMLSTFISTLVCFIVALCIVASGVWTTGLTSTALTIAAFNTVFGVYGGWIVTFLSTIFGAGVMVAFAYITRAVWLFLTGGRFGWFASVFYAVATVMGALMPVQAMWSFAGMISYGLLIINLFGVLYLLPVLCRDLYGSKSRS
ncbi:MAG: alanine:cation symporter family protein [Candidatus Dependentiae bacterium]|nr:alanine:cation symporter family protein [Candidatus Dependentiae bacterium]